MDRLNHFRLQQLGNTHILHFSDRQLLDRGLLVEIQDELLAYLHWVQPASVLLSFADVEQLSSEAINILLQARKVMTAYGGELRLSDMHREIRSVFNILKLDGTLFGIYESAACALAAEA